MLDKKIGEIVADNFIYARALHYLGVDFLKYQNEYLGELCATKGIDRRRIIRSFYQFDSSTRIGFEEIESYPLELTLEYLRYAHHTYIKNCLPYINELINHLGNDHSSQHDLQVVFPLFVEDFIKHIYREEDEIFGYISFLLSLRKDPSCTDPNKIYKYGRISLKEIRAHHVDDDEMEGLRELISAFPVTDLLTETIVKEIKAFDREILYHAEIENEILFPKAIQLEESVYQDINVLG